MKVLGIDPGTHVAGYGVIEQLAMGGRPNLLECGTLKLKAPTRVDLLRELGRDVGDLLDDLRPDVLALELAHVGINAQSALAIAEARGVIMAVAFSRRVEVFQYQPSQAKKVATGRGNASKELVRAHLMRMLGIISKPKLDATDALALAVAHTVLGRASR